MMSDSKALKETLFLKRKNGRLIADDETLNKAEQYSIGYKEFLDVAKTEREAVKEAVYLAENQGFKPFQRGKKYVAGDKYYVNNRNKSIALVVVGIETVDNGINITAAHIDSPRLDLKPNPLYEDILKLSLKRINPQLSLIEVSYVVKQLKDIDGNRCKKHM